MTESVIVIRIPPFFLNISYNTIDYSIRSNIIYHMTLYIIDGKWREKISLLSKSLYIPE